MKLCWFLSILWGEIRRWKKVKNSQVLKKKKKKKRGKKREKKKQIEKKKKKIGKKKRGNTWGLADNLFGKSSYLYYD